jgi:tetratricopeptide (TPR) repeat protein
LTFLRNYQEAIYCYDKALEIDQDYSEAWYEKGKTLDKLEQYKEAITCYDKALSIDSKHVAKHKNADTNQ